MHFFIDFLSRYFVIFAKIRLERSGLFDEDYYLKNNPDVRESGIEPTLHYLLYGSQEGRNPCASFDAHEFMMTYPAWRKKDRNPVFAIMKINPGRALQLKKQETIRNHYQNVDAPVGHTGQKADPFVQHYARQLQNALNQNSTTDYIAYQDYPALNPLLRLIAFYLPQFHPIPENDAWWGKGFTEWTNVSKAVPMFSGHYQPRLPGELGYYDLRVPEVMHRQVELAKNYGLSGFCFHYYWFSGRRLLEKPLFQYLNDKTLDFPFCISWANENWTRRWDGREQDILIEQEHHLENDKNFIADLIPVLQDPRYIRINGRPLILVYHLSLLDNPLNTSRYWRSYCQEKGLGNPYLVAAKTFGLEDISGTGFDATVEFPPHNIFMNASNEQETLLNTNFKGQIYHYLDLFRKSTRFRSSTTPSTNFKTVAPGWDNTARKPDSGFIFKNSTPAAYRRWLEEAALHSIQTAATKDEKIVFINAWNEWAEGAYLEPDRRYGYAFLEETRKMLHALPGKYFTNHQNELIFPGRKNNDTALIAHVYYEDFIQDLVPVISRYRGAVDFYFSIPESKPGLAARLFEEVPEALILKVPNKGRDIAPFLEIFRIIDHLEYQTFLKIHSKKSPHREDGDAWRKDVLNKLAGDQTSLQKIEQYFEKNPQAGAIGPADHIVAKHHYWGFNAEKTEELARQTGLQTEPQPDFCFVAGSMFWGKTKAFAFLKDLPVQTDTFENEPIKKDGFLPHAIERLLGWGLASSGYSIVQMDTDGTISDPLPETQYAYAERTKP